MSKERLVRWLKCSVVGDGSTDDPFRPKLFEVRRKHLGEWSAVYYPSNRPYEFCLVRFTERGESPSDLTGDVIGELETTQKWNDFLNDNPHFKRRWLNQPVEKAEVSNPILDPLDPVETRYFRSDSHTVNTYALNKLLTSRSGVSGSIDVDSYANEATYKVSYIFRIEEDGTATQLGADITVGTRFEVGEGIQSNTWNCPETDLELADAVWVELYLYTPPFENWLDFITEQLGAVKLNAAQWTFYLYTVWLEYVASIFLDTATYDTRIGNFTWTAPPAVAVKPVWDCLSRAGDARRKVKFMPTLKLG